MTRSAIQRWRSGIDRLVADGMQSREAYSRLREASPSLHRMYLAAVTSSFRMLAMRKDTEMLQFNLDAISPWAIDEGMLNNIFAQFVFRSQSTRRPAPRYQITGDGVALIRFEGVLSKSKTDLGDSTVDLGSAVRKASNDKSVRAIMLIIESPGGTYAGAQTLADEIAGAAKCKRIECYIDDTCLASAYWFASQCHHITINKAGVTGAIGVFTVAVDRSERAERQGFKVHVIRSGDHKAIGIPGAVISKEQLTYLQTLINSHKAILVADIARGRKVSLAVASSWADGRSYVGNEAVKLGMVDACGSLDDAYEKLVARIAKAA